MKKLFVNEDACIGCGACVAIDPEHFDFNGDISDVISQENIENENVANAIASCPTNAIGYKEENSEKSENCDCNECHCDNCHCE